MQAVARLADDLQITIIAEGLETLGEIEAVQDSGIRFGQGFALGRPQWLPVTHRALPIELTGIDARMRRKR